MAMMAILLAGLGLHGARAAGSCQGLAGMRIGDATVTSAQPVTPPFSAPNIDPPEAVPVRQPFCRARGLIEPAPGSRIGFELWLPPAASWNGRLEAIGNGGFAGSMIYQPMAWALAEGYAAVATDTGHQGRSIDAGWALDHDQAIVDFAWRGVHETALAAKSLVGTYYDRPAQHAYFNGCSDGGREALMEAQRFPTDYDGIVAGAPANQWTRLLGTSIWNIQSLDASPASALPPQALRLVTAAVLAQCHATDGVLDDPSQCRVDLAPLLCRGADHQACLTRPQLVALGRIYGGPRDESGRSLGPGFSPGAEAGPAAWSLWITGRKGDGSGSLADMFGGGFFRDMVYPHGGWSFARADLTRDLAAAQARFGDLLDAPSPDLSAFAAAGGKLIQYHGWADAGIPPAMSVQYYRAAARSLGGLGKLRAFWRLFMAPGMYHCGLGPGPNAVGGVFGLPAASADPGHDPQHDIVAALDAWVRQDRAPERIIAARYVDDDPAKGIAAQRPWCAYPAVSRALGNGRFECRDAQDQRSPGAR